ncbi:hypothetical protein EYC54_17455 [Xanthomonas oryzae]|nr:hypothetical protein EYC54_17455 [Xanthomonas oryzae]
MSIIKENKGMLGLALTLICTLIGSAYKAGKEARDGEASKVIAMQYSKHSAEIAALNNRISAMTTDLALSHSRQESAQSAAVQWKAAYDALLLQLKSEKEHGEGLALALGKADNCAFIHEQIKSLEREMRDTVLLWTSDDGGRKSREPLELQIQRYQEQLGNCNH